MLDYYKESLPESFLCPDNLVSISGEVSGFTIPKFDGVNLADLLHFKEIETKEKIYYLIKIGEILNQLKSIREYGNLKQIFINDLQEANIMVNPKNKELKIIDLDSCKILNNDFFPARYLGVNHFVKDKKHKYIRNSDDDVIANENSDLLCYNIIILNFLYGSSITRISIDDYYQYLNYLDKLKFNKYLLDCFNKLTLCCDNKNPVGFLDTITNEQAIRAKKLVFEYNKR